MKGIDKVNYLEIHTYVPLKISSNIKFDQLRKKILTSKIIQNDRLKKMYMIYFVQN